jgi:threonine/homoserine/homoserine lactone efflux protein
MLDTQAIVAIPGASLALGLLPGPDDLFVPAQSMIKRRAAGSFVAAGRTPWLSVGNH